MAELITLSVPITTPSITDYRVVQLTLDWTNPAIVIGLRGGNGESQSFQYTGATATTLMQQLNVANLSVKSLHRRIIERLVADGKLAGAISGSPD